LWPALAFKQDFGLGLDLALPLPNLNWMNPMFLRNLIDGLHSTERIKPHLGLELWQMHFALL
jgi:hypothetical protein